MGQETYEHTIEIPVPELRDIPFDEFELVKGALQREEPSFWTVNGIHEETDVPIGNIVSVLQQSDIARKSPLQSSRGEDLYTDADRKKTTREHLRAVQRILTHDF